MFEKSMPIVVSTVMRVSSDPPPRVRIFKGGVGGDALAGDTPDMRADELDSDHERRREKHRPQQAVAKLGTSLRVGRDSGWIVICRTSDETGPSRRKMMLPAFCLGAVAPFLRDMKMLSSDRALAAP
jgi:hypothetical protein